MLLCIKIYIWAAHKNFCSACYIGKYPWPYDHTWLILPLPSVHQSIVDSLMPPLLCSHFATIWNINCSKYDIQQNICICTVCSICTVTICCCQYVNTVKYLDFHKLNIDRWGEWIFQIEGKRLLPVSSICVCLEVLSKSDHTWEVYFPPAKHKGKVSKKDGIFHTLEIFSSKEQGLSWSLHRKGDWILDVQKAIFMSFLNGF